MAGGGQLAEADLFRRLVSSALGAEDRRELALPDADDAFGTARVVDAEKGEQEPVGESGALADLEPGRFVEAVGKRPFLLKRRLRFDSRQVPEPGPEDGEAGEQGHGDDGDRGFPHMSASYYNGRRMRKFAAFLLIFAALSAGAWWYLSSRGWLPAGIRQAVEETLERAAELASDTREKVRETVSAPPPLRGPLTGSGGDLTTDGVFLWTNRHRADAGRRALARNASLDRAAELKLREMFELQYFDHVSPDGEGPADKASRAGYAYIAIGENLALGNYADDEALVRAWMDSPGHRENILSTSFTELGVAVGRGNFEGHATWLAVQMFGRPLSDCPQPSAALAAEIEANKRKLEAMQAEADLRREEIENTPEPRTRREAIEYNRKVDEYNALVREINDLIRVIQGQITVYNGQVQAFNDCAAQ